MAADFQPSVQGIENVGTHGFVNSHSTFSAGGISDHARPADAQNEFG
jgi:hypothetical protein